jgi:hypothetical protein
VDYYQLRELIAGNDKFQPLGDAFVRLAEKPLGETERA